MFKTTKLLAAAILTGAILSPAANAALMFSFSFGGFCNGCTPGEQPGEVSGTISGLVDDTADQAATEVVVTSAPAFLSSLIGQNFVDDSDADDALLRNSFTVQAGAITAVNFAFFRNSGIDPNFVGFCLFDQVGICSEGDSRLIIQSAQANGFVGTGGAAGAAAIDFARIQEPQPELVPAPASTALLALGLLALGLRRRA